MLYTEIYSLSQKFRKRTRASNVTLVGSQKNRKTETLVEPLWDPSKTGKPGPMNLVGPLWAPGKTAKPVKRIGNRKKFIFVNTNTAGKINSVYYLFNE